MKMTTLLLALPCIISAGCSTVAPSGAITNTANTNLPNCFDSNYSASQNLFTITRETKKVVNQQCELIVASANSPTSTQQLNAGTYMVSVSDGGGGGAGGTIQDGSTFPGVDHRGGGGGGGAGAAEKTLQLNLTEGRYRLTIGAGGPGGDPCSGPPNNFRGQSGWLGSPTNIVNLDSGALVMGVSGAENYVRLTRYQNEKNAGIADGRGGSGPGQTSGGQGTAFNSKGIVTAVATDGVDKVTPTQTIEGGDSGPIIQAKVRVGPGGGGGASSRSVGGDGGGEKPKLSLDPANRGFLGSGGGGGSGDVKGCSGGANGGHGFVAFAKM